MSELVVPMQICWAAFDKGDPIVEGETHCSGEREPTDKGIPQEYIFGETNFGETAALVQTELVLTAHSACAEEEHKAEACRTVRERGP